MAKVTYSAEYWQKAYALVDANVHWCEYCHRSHDERKGRFYCFVRVIDIGAAPGNPANLVLACRRCRPNPRGLRLTLKQILDKIADLPFAAPSAQQAAHG